MEDNDQDKSEQPSAFKLQRARQKGTVARGTDLGFLTGLTAFLIYAWIAGSGVAVALAQTVQSGLAGGGSLGDGQFAVLAIVPLLFGVVARPLATMVGTIFVVVLLFELVQTGVVFSAQPLQPDFSRLNPAKGLKRLFTFRLLIETFKNVLKLGIYGTVGWLTIRGALKSDVGSIGDARGLMSLMASAAFRLMAAFALVALFFAIADQLIVRRDFGKKMRMSRREVRREHRDREGEPRLKQKRKQLHGEFVKLSQSLRGIKGADVLITNPEHIALALRYDPDSMSAPKIVSVGTDRIAQRLKKLAFIYGIPVIENRLLARELLRYGRLSEPIPGQCFQPVADIYNRLRKQMARDERGEGHV